jgi:hypothetical protein
MTSNTKPPYGFMADYAVGQGYVYYQDLKENPGHFWRGVYNIAKPNLEASLNTNLGILKNVDLNKTAEILRKLGENELEREMNILNNHFGMKEITKPLKLSDYPRFIKDINLLIGMGDNFKDYLTLLEQHSQKYSQKKNSQKKPRAPVASSYFGSNFITVLNRRIIEIFKSEKIQRDILNDDYKSFKKRVEKSFDSLIVQALEKTAKTTDKLSHKEDKLIKKEIQVWQDIVKLKNSLEFDPFKDTIYQRFNLDKVAEGMFEWKKERLQEKNFSNVKSREKLSEIMFTNEKNYRNVSGFIGEYLHEINVDIDLMNKHTATKVLTKNIARTDSITLYETSMEADFSKELYKELQQLDNKLVGDTLESNRKIIEDFTRNFLDKSDTSFIKYTSTKVSSLGESFEKYGFGTKTKPEEIMNLLDRAGITGTDNLLEVLYNTGKGAILEDRREIRDKVKENLIKMVAYILFDDWESFGEGQENRQVIHIFNLNKVMVPLSYLLIAMSDAIENTDRNLNKVFSIQLSAPKIHFDPPIKVSKDKTMKKFWEEQAVYAKNNTKLTIQFIRNFKTLIVQMLNSYN